SIDVGRISQCPAEPLFRAMDFGSSTSARTQLAAIRRLRRLAHAQNCSSLGRGFSDFVRPDQYKCWNAVCAHCTGCQLHSSTVDCVLQPTWYAMQSNSSHQPTTCIRTDSKRCEQRICLLSGGEH